ncbi:MAG: L-2-amino-thiazoline-4-carboxylic acid hydrolase [Bacteroidota bacterium]
MDIPVEKKFKILCQITRASHFAWRQAAVESCPSVNPVDIVNKMWEITGHETSKAYLKRLEPDKPLPKQVADSIAWSSVTMGEDAKVVEGADEKEVFLRHDGCPWYDWHQRLGLLEEDRPGCDKWFETAVDDINKELGTNVKIETQKSLPDGDDCCLRKIWVE